VTRKRSRLSAKKAGTAWESEIVRHLNNAGWIHAERRRLAGALDKGDIAGIPGVVIEAKNTTGYDIAGALDEAETERQNAEANYGVAWIKRKGKPTAADGFVVMDGATFTRLLKEAGW
jgi:hypothetical protein